MIADFAKFMTQGFLAPRATVRRLLDGGHGFDVALMFVALAYILEAVLVKLAVSKPPDAAHPLSDHFRGGMLSVCAFFILSGLIYWLGRMMGGIATLAQAQIASAWFMLVTVLLTPLAIIGLPSQFFSPPTDPSVPIDLSDGNPTVLMVISGASVWLLSSAVAEAHGFQSVWRVAGAIIAVPLVAMVLVSAMVGG